MPPKKKESGLAGCRKYEIKMKMVTTKSTKAYNLFLAENCLWIDHDTCQLKEGTEERDRQAERIVRESRQVRVEQVKSHLLAVSVAIFPN